MGGCVTLCYLYFFLHSCIISMLFFDVGILPKNSWRLGTLTLNFKIRSSFISNLLTRGVTQNLWFLINYNKSFEYQ